MRSRWFHAPLFHTELHPEKRVSWLELFYDLIFVAGIIQLGDALSDGVARGEGLFALVKFGAYFVPLWLAWTGYTFYANRYTVDDFFHRIVVFVQMFALGAMSIAAPIAMGVEPDPRPFAIAFAAAQVIVAGLHVRAYLQERASRSYSWYWGLVFAAGALVWMVAAFVPRPFCYYVMGAGVLGVLFAPLTTQSRAHGEEWPLDQEHLAERYGLLTIIVLGESFVKVLSYLTASEHGLDAEYLLKGCFNLAITCCLWWIYFDDVAGAQLKKGRGTWIVWLYGHLPLAVGITGVGVAVKWALDYDLAESPDGKSAFLLAGTLALTFFAVALIDSVTERKHAELSDRQRVNVRVLSGAVLLVVAQVGTSMSSGVFLGVVTAVCVAQVLFDILMSPFAESEIESVSLAEVMRDRRVKKAKDAAKPSTVHRRDVSEAVRKGAPSELRRDLYFFFMEGSWTRMIVSLLFMYVMVNVLFAGLYLLEPASIGVGSADAFGDAFAFSVQTMSTIGYGAMSPQTAYGDLIVAIEAAVGLLGVALATGLMFAKASRPRASVLFSKNLLVNTMDGKRVLTFRVGNARGNEVVEASITVAVIRDHLSPEGHSIRKVTDLSLLRSRTPVFALSWVVFHVIDDESPLRDVDFETCDGVFGFVVTMMGHDATYGMTTHARKTYWPEEVLVDHRFVDVMSQLEDGRLMIDYAKFHDVEAEHD